jgi:hypothetical protein
MQKRFVWSLLVVVFMMVGPGAATQAAAQGAPPPDLAPLHTVRERTLLSFNGTPIQVCQREWQSWNRVHGVCEDLASVTAYNQRYIQGTVVEFVLFDGTRYERVNTQTIWSATPDEGFAPDRDLNEAFFRIAERAQLSRLSDTEIAGVAAAHYQYWVIDPARSSAAGGQVVYDQFISAQRQVLQSQTSVRGTIPGLGSGDLTELHAFSDFNMPVEISRPA